MPGPFREVIMRLSSLCPALAALLVACTDHPSLTTPANQVVRPSPAGLLTGARLDVPARGQYIFRHWTFGDEPFWSDLLHLNEVVETAVSPATALAVGLKVDAERLPPGFLGSADLTSPATTVELLRRDAVVGGRVDGLPNRDLNVGAIVALSPVLPPAVRAVSNSWGPGKYDAEFNRDGLNNPVVIRSEEHT